MMSEEVQGVLCQDFAAMELPSTWPDNLSWRQPLALGRLVSKVLHGKAEPVVLPPNVPGAERIPSYVLQEFHRLPNGNFSKCISRGYARGFDRAMLGTLRVGRARVANALIGAQRALDIGCGAGHMTQALRVAGIPEVWGLDPSPYLLQYAAQTYHDIRWVQAVAEKTDFPDAYFDAVSICFVLHEIPPRYLQGVLAELARIVRVGGCVSIVEPSRTQVVLSGWALWRQYGWRGLYFKWLAARVFEPFLDAWHKQNFTALLAQYGFVVEVDESACPFRFVVAKKMTPICTVF